MVANEGRIALSRGKFGWGKKIDRSLTLGDVQFHAYEEIEGWEEHETDDERSEIDPQSMNDPKSLPKNNETMKPILAQLDEWLPLENTQLVSNERLETLSAFLALSGVRTPLIHCPLFPEGSSDAMETESADLALDEHHSVGNTAELNLQTESKAVKTESASLHHHGADHQIKGTGAKTWPIDSVAMDNTLQLYVFFVFSNTFLV
ncbi:unnamed protein product [Agarophyton chilense]